MICLYYQDQSRIIRDGNEPVRWGNANLNNAPPAAVGEAHQALLNIHGPTGFQPYYRPSLFPFRVSILIAA